MKFEELEAAAGIAAATVPDFRDDCRQEAWVRFLRYKPRTVGGARLMAFSARNDLLRRERKQRRLLERLAAGEQPHTPRQSGLGLLFTMMQAVAKGD